MQTLIGEATRGRSRVLDGQWKVLIILVKSEWTNGLNCEIKGLDPIIRITGYEDIESKVKLVG